MSRVSTDWARKNWEKLNNGTVCASACAETQLERERKKKNYEEIQFERNYEWVLVGGFLWFRQPGEM